LAVENQAAIIERYTDGRTKSRVPEITLTQVAQVLISLEEDSAVLMDGESCQLEDQEELDKWRHALKLTQEAHTFRNTYAFLKKRAEAGKKYCNHVVYLRCQEDPRAPGSHVCGCPTRLTWEENKCVYSEGERCFDIGKYYVHKGDTDKQVLVYHFTTDSFGDQSYPSCEKGALCDRFYFCLTNINLDYYASLPEIAAFVRGNLDST